MKDRDRQVLAQRTRPDIVGSDYAVAPDASPPAAPPAAEFLAEITGFGADGTNRWKYSWKEVVKTSTGHGGGAWTFGTRSGTTATDPARNFVEVMNSGTGVQGNGVDLSGADFPAGFSIQPVPAERILVRMMPVVVVGAGVIEYWFSYENGIDGTCT